MEKYNEILNKIKCKIKTNKKLFSATLAIITIPLILLIITKIMPSSINLRHINKFSKEISSINLYLAECISKESVDPEQSKKTLTDNITKLKDVQSKLSDLEVSSNASNTKALLDETLTNNISICEKAMSLYNNASTSELSSKLKDYNVNLEALKSLNKDLNALGVKSVASKDSLEFFEKTYKYFDTLIQINIMKDINSEKNSAYILAIDKMVSNFKEIDEDLRPAFNDIIKNNRDIHVLISDISNKKSTFENIKNDFYSLSIPEEGNELNSSLLQTINLYDIYINSMNDALDSYITDSNNNVNFENSFSKHADFITSLNNLCNKLESFKRK
ncbi:MAG: hypothetical protein ACRCVJ_13830 [Clostridium sp.]|uniref:hypothetical protein n=1 Tax=Clostridium sp. TaxID=1506 RepID=UPI003F3D6B55